MSIVTEFSLDDADRITRCRTLLLRREEGYVMVTRFSCKDLDWGEDEEKSMNRLRGWVGQSIATLSETLHRQHARWRLANEIDIDQPLQDIRYLFE